MGDCFIELVFLFKDDFELLELSRSARVRDEIWEDRPLMFFSAVLLFESTPPFIEFPFFRIDWFVDVGEIKLELLFVLELL